MAQSLIWSSRTSIPLLSSIIWPISLDCRPTVAIMQWRNEIAAHTDGLKVLVWHGHARESDINVLKKIDVVLTTYAVLERWDLLCSYIRLWYSLYIISSCFRKQQNGFKRKGLIIKEKSALHQIHWNRIVLDEAHNIKERSTNTAKATFELKSNYRWCLSGTPLQNRVGELYSLVRFLGGDPFSYYFCMVFSLSKCYDDTSILPTLSRQIMWLQISSLELQRQEIVWW